MLGDPYERRAFLGGQRGAGSICRAEESRECVDVAQVLGAFSRRHGHDLGDSSRLAQQSTDKRRPADDSGGVVELYSHE